MEMQDDDFLTKRPKIKSWDAEGGSGNTSINKGGNGHNNNNNNSYMISDIFSQHAPIMKPTSPTTYILSFNDSTIVEASEKQSYHNEQTPPSKGVEAKHEFEQKAKETKKGRSSLETMDHTMAERKRRRELTERFITLSAAIPGLKKIDKSSILSEAISHVKQLKERVRELEEQSKNRKVEPSVSFIEEMKCGGECYCRLPTVEARVLKKDLLIRIHCNKQSHILLKILELIKTLHLSTITNSVLPFGTSTLDITIIAQMGDKFNINTNDFVKILRQAILESPKADSDSS